MRARVCVTVMMEEQTVRVASVRFRTGLPGWIAAHGSVECQRERYYIAVNVLQSHDLSKQRWYGSGITSVLVAS